MHSAHWLHIMMFVYSLGALGACGNDSSQPAARERTARASCDRLTACGEVGAGKTYESRDACDVKMNSLWQDILPPSQCDGRINSEALDVCLDSIALAECGNALDLLNIFGNKCAKSKLCSEP
ncbi:MAG: DUF6184 family natural product biosynthesis lipoprotein [Deltaproteobacteria bacterium]|nr:DUF6184 family natural product biosynthesis lipoprotein [Deltaproteobacteria bacterium]